MANKNVMSYIKKNFANLSAIEILELKNETAKYTMVNARVNALAFIDAMYKLKKDERFSDEIKFHFANILKHNDKGFIIDYLKLVGFDQLPKELVQDYFVAFSKEQIDCFLTIYTFDESFLEAHFHELNSLCLFRNQLFSEDFYLKHFDDFLYYNIMETKNDWRFPSNRSNKLKLFLKLKGVSF